MDELRAHFPEETKTAEATAEAIQFKPDEAETILSLAFSEVTKWIMRRLEKEEITPEEADRWAKCTRIVFWKYLNSMEAGAIVWALLTVGLILGKKDLPTKKKKGKSDAGSQVKPPAN